MGSLAYQSSPPPDMASAVDAMLPPELDDADYFNEVLRLAVAKSEVAVEEEMLAKALALGIQTSRPSTDDKRNTSSAESQASTVATYHARTFSSGSNGSASTVLTSHSSLLAAPIGTHSPPNAVTRRRSKSLNFSQYEKYLLQIDPNINQPKFLKEAPLDHFDTSGQSLFSVSTRKSYFSIKDGIKKIRWRTKSRANLVATVSCICCRDDFDKTSALQSLPCGHTYCGECLRVMIQQATTDESKMPPRCCTQPIPGTIIKNLQSREEQNAFLKAVLQFSTPWEARIFCPNTSCGEFIPPRNKIDPKHPFDVVCRKCRTRVCVMCKRNAHPIGKDCPEDWELDAVLKMGEKSGWRRCYKCRTLVELTQGCTHMTCRCKAQFCYICGAVWDLSVGCPNFCNGEEELERRRVEEEARMAELEAEKAAREAAAAVEAAERAEAENRTKESAEFMKLKNEMDEELQRFRAHIRKTKWAMWTRHAEKKLELVDKYNDQIEKMKERHAKTLTHLEERQIEAEMELRATLEQSERSVRIRLKHMEAYCDGLGRNPNSSLPPRVVTERDLRELGQQYNLRDGMSRLHQAKINVLRDRQAKRMEELLERQEKEMDKLTDKKDKDIENLAAESAVDEDTLVRVFNERKERAQRRWELGIEIRRKELEEEKGVKYAPIDIPSWPDDTETQDDILATVPE